MTAIVFLVENLDLWFVRVFFREELEADVFTRVLNCSICSQLTRFSTASVARYPMQQNQERWMELCALAAEEEDSDKLLELTREINRLLAEKEQRLNTEKNKTSSLTTFSS